MAEDPSNKWRRREARRVGMRRRVDVPLRKAETQAFDGRVRGRMRRLAFREKDSPEMRRRDKRPGRLMSKLRARAWDVDVGERNQLETVDARRSRAIARSRRPVLRSQPWMRWTLVGASLSMVGALVAAWLIFARMRQARLEPVEMADLSVLEVVNEERILAFFEDYFARERWEDRLELVRHPEQTRSRMERYYRTRPLERSRVVKLSRMGTLENSGKEFAFAVGTNELGETVKASFTMLGADLRLDWESMVGFSDLELDQLVGERPEEPQIVRVRLEKGEYYNYGFDQERFACYRIGTPAADVTCYAYLPRDHRDFAGLEAALENRAVAADGTGIQAKGVLYPTLRVRALPDAPDPKQFEIVEVIDHFWLVAEAH
ncbi:MAG TPA: hypothetical protein VMN36_09810 [Verrucomicrobiales bacterium]|nr:hypothetical protein [Verrucomicrobiales bacterium]